MKRSIIKVLICMLGCLLIAGCKGNGASGNDGTGPKSSLAPSEDEKTDDQEADKDQKKEKKKNRVPLSGKVEKEDTETDSEEVYEPVLDEIRDVLSNGYDHDRDYDYVSDGIMERTMYPEGDDLTEVIGYYYVDLNDDGIRELLIGENGDDEYGNNPNEEAFIYSGFSCKDGKPVCFVEGWARNRQHYMGDGRFLNTGSSGAMNSCFGEWHLSDDGTEQVWDDFYFTMDDMKGGLALYHNTTGEEDPGSSERLKISEDEFWDIQAGLALKCGAIAWTPMGPKENGGRHLVNTMTDNELLKIENRLENIGYYGFLTTTYDDPRDIYWNSVLYVGAGIDENSISKDVKKAYLKATDDDEIYTDLTVISGKKLKKFVKDTTGYDYSEMNYPLDWVYLKDYDLYINEHGDTNQFPVEVTGGSLENGEYTVTYIGPDGLEYCVVYRDEGGKLKFISNIPRWMVEDPTNGGDVDQSDIKDGMIIPDSDSRKLTEDDLKFLDKGELRIARNEIYARHGRKFTSEDLQNHFNSMDWYFPMVEASDFDESVLNEYEKYNLNFISKYEKTLK